MRNLWLLLTILLAGSAAAEAPQPQANYIHHLCSAAIDKPDESSDYYLQQIRSMTMRGYSPSSLNKTDFDDDVAKQVVNSWQSLSPAERQQASNETLCQQILLQQP